MSDVEHVISMFRSRCQDNKRKQAIFRHLEVGTLQSCQEETRPAGILAANLTRDVWVRMRGPHHSPFSSNIEIHLPVIGF